MQADFIFQIAVLIMSVVIHEVSHGYAAAMLGDNTARYQGRLTLNPLSHLDLFGSLILPFILYISQVGIILGWAKPVPYNPYNLRPGRWSEAKVAVAGPLANVAIAIIFGLVLRLTATFGIGSVGPAFVQAVATIVFINLLLAIFNLTPIPPLDGSKILFALFPEKLVAFRNFFERYGLMLVLLFIFFLWQSVAPLIVWLFSFITGVTL